jgi:ABC-type taurine transport system ATPase subunit
MSLLRFEGAGHGRLYGVHLELAAGLYVVLGTEHDGTPELVELATGMRGPRRGRVLVDGRAPFSSPEARRRIAGLLRGETPPSGETVARALSRIFAVRGRDRAERLLDEYGVETWAARAITSLSARELRTIALLVALSHEHARLFALFEPFAIAPELDPNRVCNTLQARAEEGACVLVATASTADALRLGGSWLLLERGTLGGLAVHGKPPELGAPSARALSVRSPAASKLGQSLTDQPHVSGISFGPAAGGGELLVFGDHPELLAQTVVSVARRQGIRVDALGFVAPPLEALLAAKDGWARGAYDRSYAAAQAEAARAASGVYGS